MSPVRIRLPPPNSYLKHFLIFEKWQLETKENYNSYSEIWMEKSILKREISQAKKAVGPACPPLLLSVYGRTTDALASGGDEGRGRLR